MFLWGSNPNDCFLTRLYQVHVHDQTSFCTIHPRRFALHAGLWSLRTPVCGRHGIIRWPFAILQHNVRARTHQGIRHPARQRTIKQDADGRHALYTHRYHSGSWLFLIGSLFLMNTTAPATSIVGHNRSTCIATWSPFRRDGGSALWWGSFAFAAGSVWFALDAAGNGIRPYVNVLAGYVSFLIGQWDGP